MRKSQIALGERWKWHFQVSRFQIFLGDYAPRSPYWLTPLALACPPTYITLATALLYMLHTPTVAAPRFFKGLEFVK